MRHTNRQTNQNKHSTSAAVNGGAK